MLGSAYRSCRSEAAGITSTNDCANVPSRGKHNESEYQPTDKTITGRQSLVAETPCPLPGALESLAVVEILQLQ